MLRRTALLTLLVACGDDSASPDAGFEDGGTRDVPSADVVVDIAEQDATSRDAEASDVAIGDAGPATTVIRGDREFDVAVPGRVAAAVVLFHGGRTAMTCDRGRTWHEGGYFMEPAEDHSPFSAIPGISGGREGFYMSLGWGADGHALFSDDGVTWEELGESSFTFLEGTRLEDTAMDNRWRPGHNFYSGDDYRQFWRHHLMTSDDGRTWVQTPTMLENVSHLREVEYFRGADRLVMRVGRDENVGGMNVRTEFFLLGDSTGAMREVHPQDRGCPAWGPGPVVYWNGHLMGGGSCVSDDDGETFVDAELDAIRALASDGEVLFVSHRVDGGQGAIVRSVDGETFEQVHSTGHQRNLVRQITYSPGTAYLAVGPVGEGDEYAAPFHYSDDGLTWTSVENEWRGWGSPRSLDTGFVAPSEACPAE